MVAAAVIGGAATVGSVGATMAGVGAIASVAGGAMQASAAKSAANAQVNAANQASALQKQAADESLAEQQRQYDTNIGLQAPFRQAGLTAQDQYMTYLGMTPDAGAKDANGNDIKYNVDQSSPDYGRYKTADYTSAQFNQGLDPGYQFRLSEGLKAISAMQASRGGMVSGAGIKALERYSQDYASNEYTNSFNRYQTERANTLGSLQPLIATGTNATNQSQSASTNYANQTTAINTNAANQMASNTIGAGNAMAASTMYGATAYGNAFNTAANGFGKAFNSGIYGNGNKSVWDTPLTSGGRTWAADSNNGNGWT